MFTLEFHNVALFKYMQRTIIGNLHMPTIRLSEKTASLLKQIAVPLEDSYDSVIFRLAEAAVSGIPYPRPERVDKADRTDGREVWQGKVSGDEHPDLLHSDVRDAFFGEQRINKPSWSSLINHAHEVALRELGFSELRVATKANIREGKFAKQGFKYLSAVDLSLQGTDANDSWENSLRLAKRLNVAIKVIIEWPHGIPQVKEKAGTQETFSWRPGE